MEIFRNPFRGSSDMVAGLADVPLPSEDAASAVALTRRCPKQAPTVLRDMPDLARQCGVGALSIKDERDRMGLGSFKALGAAYVIACEAREGRAQGQTYVTASAGNHGLSVAAGAQAFGAKSVVFIAETVPEAFAHRLMSEGAEVMREGATYEDSMQAAQDAARKNGWQLLSDSSWPGYFDRPRRLMEGYLVLMAETADQISQPPSHVFLQAGVGGLACAAAVHARAVWPDRTRIIVVEPQAAPALAASVAAGRPVAAEGPVSAMGRLDCKEPSLIALKGLARDADHFATITEAEGLDGARIAQAHGLDTTPSGAAGLAGLAASDPHRDALGLNDGARVLVILSEGPTG